MTHPVYTYIFTFYCQSFRLVVRAAFITNFQNNFALIDRIRNLARSNLRSDFQFDVNGVKTFRKMTYQNYAG